MADDFVASWEADEGRTPWNNTGVHAARTERVRAMPRAGTASALSASGRRSSALQPQPTPQPHAERVHGTVDEDKYLRLEARAAAHPLRRVIVRAAAP